MDDVLAKDRKISQRLAENERILRSLFNNCFDITFRPFFPSDAPAALLVYIAGLADTDKINNELFRPDTPSQWNSLFTDIHLSTVASSDTTESIQEAVEGLLQGQSVLFMEGRPDCYFLDLKAKNGRTIQEPAFEQTIRGPRDSFTEQIEVNVILIRKRIQSTKLKLEPITVGSISRTKLIIVYLEGIVDELVLSQVKERIARIRTTAILESGYIEEMIEDVSFSPFPQMQVTERPDIVSANLFEGKVAVLTDGTPNALIVPMTFWTTFQSAEDYYERFIFASLMRWTRLILFAISLYLPSLFVAITTFHSQLMPTNFLFSLTAAREGVPFPSVIEALLIEFMFEGLREAGIRLPKATGSAVSIVGALVIGQAAVQAGIVSAPMVIVVSMTGIASFAIPRYNMSIAFRILKFPMLILSGMFGLYGVTMGTIALLVHLARLETFGVPYLSPVSPLRPEGIKEVFIRPPKLESKRFRNLFARLRGKIGDEA
ncbi:spore germination protein KA [Paenibacillus taihuensis]|uniref:Spore germination protein KA n=1 Tax=Paenibacillus taihuensis TaxID=1156355 RepID=A0A3D9SI90_9BACL|nr:spore germination protein [Paenibacillus taihuensis]REE91598.1 spore germination protein KA [Paenibacillus taihuensis]